jgi:hypothetical protein
MSLSGMRQILEGMDWGTTLTTEERYIIYTYAYIL